MNSYCSLENIFFWTLSNICNSVREHYFMRQLQTKWHIFRWSLFYNELVFACYNYYAPYEWIYFQQTTHRVTYVKLHSFELNWLFVLWIKFTVCALNWFDRLYVCALNWIDFLYKHYLHSKFVNSVSSPDRMSMGIYKSYTKINSVSLLMQLVTRNLMIF